MTVTNILMDLGVPANVLKNSTSDPNIPNEYQVGTSAVEYMPHWVYATVDNGVERTHVRLLQPELSQEDILVNLRTVISKTMVKEIIKTNSSFPSPIIPVTF